MRRDVKERRVQQLIGGLVSSQPITPEAVAALFRITRPAAESLIAEAERRLAARAEVNKQSEIGRAKSQCEEIYRLALEKKDLRNALLARSELSRLLALDVTEAPAPTVDEEEVNRARQALESLGICEPNLPIDELARQLVLWILTHKKTGELA